MPLVMRTSLLARASAHGVNGRGAAREALPVTIIASLTVCKQKWSMDKRPKWWYVWNQCEGDDNRGYLPTTTALGALSSDMHGGTKLR